MSKVNMNMNIHSFIHSLLYRNKTELFSESRNAVSRWRPTWHQNRTIWFLGHDQPLHKNSSKFVHNFAFE